MNEADVPGARDVSPGVIAARTAADAAAADAAAAADRGAKDDVPRWGSPGNRHEPIFLLDPPAEVGETPAVDADAVVRATTTIGGGGGGGGR